MKKRDLYIGSLTDWKMKNGQFRGIVFNLSRPKGKQAVAIVYGRTLREMRALKHSIVDLLSK